VTLAVDKLNHRDYLEFEFRLIGDRLPACQLPTTYGTQQGRKPSGAMLATSAMSAASLLRAA
jgi:hypothetical protein